MPLSTGVYRGIRERADESDEALEARQFGCALEVDQQALALVPEPWLEYNAATWLLAAIGDVLFTLEEFSEARESLLDAVQTPEGQGTPYLHLRLGQCCF